jgi:acyl-coenzyme A thioesterase PaaI-like protein
MTTRDELAGTQGEAPTPEGLHMVGDMDLSTLLVSRERCLVHAPLSPGVSSPHGGASLAMLLTLVDVGASSPALASAEGWTATQDLSLFRAGSLEEGPILVDNRLLRVGRKVAVAVADVYDGHGMDDLERLPALLDGAGGHGPGGGLSLAGRSLVTYALLPRSAATGADDYDPMRWLGTIERRGGGTLGTETIVGRLGFRTVEARAGVLELERSGYVVNSIGTINGGAQSYLAEAAAEALCPGKVAADMELHYLSQVKVGPARSSGVVLRETAEHAVAMVELRDAGNDDQLLAVATVTLVTPSVLRA